MGSRVNTAVSVGSENSAHPGVAGITDSKLGATSRNDSTDRLNTEWRAKLKTNPLKCCIRSYSRKRVLEEEVELSI